MATVTPETTAAPVAAQAHPHCIAEAKGIPGSVEEMRQAAAAIIADEQTKFNKPTLPMVQVNDRQLRSTTTEAVAALHEANNPPEIFVRMGELVRIQADEDGRPIIKELSEAGVRYYLSQAADFVNKTQKGSIKVSPPRDLVQNVMAAPYWPFPALKGIVEVPVLRPDGSILATPGYDPATKLYYRPVPGLECPLIPLHPTQDEAKKAAQFINDELLHGFPFVDNASRANALAALITPIVRHAIPGRVPAGINTATKAGTGKTMMQEMIGAISTGRWTPMYNPPIQRDNDAEWSKVITAALLNGSTIVCFDNVDGLLQSPSLSSAITTKVYRGRILGLSKIVDIPVNVSWFINGNNVRLGGDMPRRCYWIRLDAKMSRPWERKCFKHKDLGAWVMENQGQLITALLTMARAWYIAGCPKPNTPKLGSFESWCDTVGGILQFAGITDFLGNQEKMYELSDVEGQEWEMFLLAWQERYGDAVVLVKELVDEIQKEGGSVIKDTLPSDLAGALTKKGGSLSRTLGWALPKREGALFGDSGVHLVRVPKADPQTKANGWKVLN
ncbi:MAG: hypothetical protein KKD99_06845 [Proteobacteria bacterium]|nr:hypothetical protein [Pseudomonadota bacterium]MBU4448286.1 hypothetical protein [Pseudomonadota bacterium]